MQQQKKIEGEQSFEVFSFNQNHTKYVYICIAIPVILGLLMEHTLDPIVLAIPIQFTENWLFFYCK